MPPLHVALVEVHREYERANKAARNMTELYRNAMTVLDVLNDKCNKTQAQKDELSEKLRKIEEKLKQAEDQLRTCQLPHRLAGSDQELQQRL